MHVFSYADVTLVLAEGNNFESTIELAKLGADCDVKFHELGLRIAGGNHPTPIRVGDIHGQSWVLAVKESNTAGRVVSLDPSKPCLTERFEIHKITATRGRGDESFPTIRKKVVESPSRRYHVPNNTIILNRESEEEEEEDVIDLGAPRCRRPVSAPRVPRLYTPNPRLYPGPKTKTTRHKRRSGPTEDSRPKLRKRKFTRPVPNSRLYRPAPPRPPPPAPCPHATWPPPAPRALESASRAALRVLHARRLRVHEPSPEPLPPAPLAPYTARAPRLVVTLPAAGDARSAMATHKHSTSPDCSDGNDPSSAPSEFLAEFLSAIMRRQYAEALKYCQLILQYEPNNATARGFYPLLRHKLRAHEALRSSPSPQTTAAKEVSSSSEGTSSRHENLLEPQLKQSAETEGSAEGSGSEEMEQGSGSGSGSGACSSLELDSLDARSAPTSPRRTDTTDPSDSSSWDSGRSHSERDDNGNPAPRLAAEEAEGAAADVRNDNLLLQTQSSSMSSLQRLRAHFACSIK